jgi:hypothetical protein
MDEAGSERLARNRATLPEVLAELARDEESWVRVAVAANPSLPLDGLDGETLAALTPYLAEREDLTEDQRALVALAEERATAQ